MRSKHGGEKLWRLNKRLQYIKQEQQKQRLRQKIIEQLIGRVGNYRGHLERHDNGFDHVEILPPEIPRGKTSRH